MPTPIALIKILTILAAAFVIGYYLYVGAKAYRMESGDFRPTPYSGSPESQQALSELLKLTERVEWNLSGSETQVGYFSAGTSGATIVILHGSPGNAAGFHPWVLALVERGVGSLLIDLPGYGASEGKRSWSRHYDQSVMLGLNFLVNRPEVDPTQIAILGYSQGGNIAARVAAADDRISRIISVASYTNLYDQLNHQFRWRLPGIGLFAVASARAAGVDFDLMDSVRHLSQVSHKPLLVISGSRDHAIPVEMAEILAATSQRSELWIIEGGDHINLAGLAGEAFYDRIAAFAIRKLL